MRLRHDTTNISIETTVGEIHTCLATHGANAIVSEYDDTGTVIALRCHLRRGEQDIAFRLPSDWRPVPTWPPSSLTPSRKASTRSTRRPLA